MPPKRRYANKRSMTSYGFNIPTAIAAGRHVYRNKAKYIKAAKVVQRYVKKRYAKSKYAKRVVQDVVKLNNIKHTQQTPSNGDTAVLAISMGSFVSSPLAYPVPSTIYEGIYEDGRLTKRIMTKGIKICRAFHFDAVNYNQPIEVHWALLQWKDTDPPVSDWPARLKDKFFSALSVNEKDNFYSFVDYSASDQFRAIYNCAKINPNNDVKIITHQKKVICSQDNNTSPSGKNMWKIDKYFKLDIMTEFNDGATQPHHPVIEVMWYNAIGPISFPTNPVVYPWLKTWNWNKLFYVDKKL
jgi:hypothetical protein